ncbi:hypothetical protein [Leucobacter chromiireducens]|nr:hypothetical protein [Leucobacter chromiireducens]
MLEKEDLERLMAECREFGLADVKALEAGWSDLAQRFPGDGAELMEKLMAFLRVAAESTREMDRLNGEVL